MMDHPSLDELLKEPLPERVSEHLEACPACRIDARMFKSVANTDLDLLPGYEMAQQGMKDARSRGSESLYKSISGSDADADTDLLPRGTVVDRYTVESLLGRGGMAVVYLVRHNQLDSLHALKLLTIPSKSIRKRLVREGRTQSGVLHPNIVRVTDLIDVDGAPGLVMQYIPGASLHEFIGIGELSIAQIDSIATDVLNGLAAAHNAGMIHRDLKPANIKLSPENNRIVAKVADFGLAKALDPDKSDPDLKTQSGLTMGTPPYMAPEQLSDASKVDKRADVFAAGALLYELATGKRAFIGQHAVAIYNRVLKADYLPPREVRELPERMYRAIQGALVVDLDKRIGSCEDLLKVWHDHREPLAVPASQLWPASTLTKLRTLHVPMRLPDKAAPSAPTIGLPTTRPGFHDPPPETSLAPQAPISSTPETTSSGKRGLGVLFGALALVLLLVGLWGRQAVQPVGTPDPGVDGPEITAVAPNPTPPDPAPTRVPTPVETEAPVPVAVAPSPIPLERVALPSPTPAPEVAPALAAPTPEARTPEAPTTDPLPLRSVAISTKPLGALLFIDGVPAGKTPQLNLQLPDGDHEIVIESDEIREIRTITVGERDATRHVFDTRTGEWKSGY